MLRDRLIDLYYDLREFVGRNRKIVLPVFLFLCVVITVGTAFGLRHMSRSESETGTTVTVTSTDEENPLELNAYEDVNALMEEYYQASADGDDESIAAICSYISDEERIRIQELGSYIDEYTTVDVYTKTGPEDGSYIAYVYSTLTLVDKEWEIPGLQTFYVCSEDGALYINSDETLAQSVSEYIQLASLEDDVVDLNNQTAAAYNDLLASDEDLSEYLDQMASLIDISVGQRLAELSSGSSDDDEDVVYVEVTADDVNVRKSASAEGTKIGTAQSGDQYQLVEELSDGWTEIIYNGQTGYIKSDYVTVVE